MRILLAGLLLAVAVPAAAQQREIRNANLPRALEHELLRMYDGGARRIDGAAVIGVTETIRGPVAAMGGPLRIAGLVEGDVAMVGGDVVLEPSGAVRGRITVIGGEVRMAEGARVGGTITSYGPARGDAWAGGGTDPWGDRRRRGRSTLSLRTGVAYNRVEGLPLMFGPVIETDGANPLRLEAFAIWRTEEGTLDTDRMGYRATLEQFLGGHRVFSVGATAFSEVDPLDRWQIRDLEAALAAALFHEDHRDHVERTGWSGFLRIRPSRDIDVRVEYRDEDHDALAARDPWTLFDGSDEWRLQPVVGIGDVRSVGGTVELDFRNRAARRDDHRDPAEGWLARLSVERPVAGNLVRPELTQVEAYPADPVVDPYPAAAIPATAYELDFTTGFIDLRRYNPVGWNSELDLRVVAGGTLDGTTLPPQYQHALGGPGALPGFETFYADCGARARVGGYGSERFFPAYGCDRFAAFQVEYRGGLDLDLGFGEPDRRDAADWWDWAWDWDGDVDLDPSWVVFFDAAQGWAFADPSLGTADRDTGLLYDAGVGLLLGDLGFYVALPLNEQVDQDPRFLIRLGRRF